MKRSILSLFLAGLLIFTLDFQVVYAQMEPEESSLGQDKPGMSPIRPGTKQPGQFPDEKPNKMSTHKEMTEAFKGLNLTEEQKDRLKSQRTLTQSQMKGLKDQLMNERQKLMNSMYDPNSSKNAIYAQQQKVSSIQNQLNKLRLDNIATFKKVLTPEQRQKLQQIGFMKNMKEKMKNNPAFKEKMQEKFKNNPEFKQRMMEKMNNNPEIKEKMQEKFKNNPEFKQRMMEKMNNHPEFKQRMQPGMQNRPRMNNRKMNK